MMSEDRRSFLKVVGCVGVGLGAGFPLLSALRRGLHYREEHPEPAANQWGLIIDVKKCAREEVRTACADACHREHNVPAIPDADDKVQWIWSERYENVFPERAHKRTYEELKDQPVLVLCNHCSHPPCVKVCPTQATWKRESDGIVMMDMHRCIGCRYCIAGCPYEARSFNWRDPRPYIKGEIRPEFPTRSMGVVEKCNFCAERLRDGKEPACVVAARNTPGGEEALIFGDLSDANSSVSQVLRRKHTICRRVGIGTGPNVYYIV
jgi:molybdopterin-containing oxidoreductase family iron-sulfur binding subunit